jgi:DNA-binding response OmpR family regulator
LHLFWHASCVGLRMRKILIVDDEPSICFAMSEYFQVHGYQVDCAQKLEEAEELLAQSCYSAVIVDLRLKGIYNTGGLEVVRFVRQKCPDSRIVVLTAYGSVEAEQEARSLGADAFLHKPAPLAEVAQIIFSLVNT